MRVTTHVLDTSVGQPASGIRLELHFTDGEELVRMKGMSCDDDSRTKDPIVNQSEVKMGHLSTSILHNGVVCKARKAMFLSTL